MSPPAPDAHDRVLELIGIGLHIVKLFRRATAERSQIVRFDLSAMRILQNEVLRRPPVAISVEALVGRDEVRVPRRPAVRFVVADVLPPPVTGSPLQLVDFIHPVAMKKQIRRLRLCVLADQDAAVHVPGDLGSGNR